MADAPTSAVADKPPYQHPDEAMLVQAVARLAFARKQHPELSRQLAQANLHLAAAIMDMDEAEDLPGRHNLYEQAAVELATQSYAQALANLLRGENPDDQDNADA